MSCEYCAAETALYQTTHTTKLYISTFGKHRTILVETDACPPYANCSSCGNITRAAFIVNYCPHCGEKLTRSTT